jgi:hypothetical protein
MPEYEIPLYLNSHADTTFRGDRHSLTLIEKIGKANGLDLAGTTSLDGAMFCLTSIIAHARTYTDAKTNRRIPLSQLEKIRATGTWMINGIWDPKWRLRCILRAAHRETPTVEPVKEVNLDVTPLFRRLRRDFWIRTTPGRFVKRNTVCTRGVTLGMIATGFRLVELVRMSWERCSWTPDYVEFVVEVKGKKRLQRIRFYRFGTESDLCPYTAIQDVCAQLTEKGAT